MIVPRTAAAVVMRFVAAGAVPVLLVTAAQGTAQAHGAPTDPASRVAACGPEGPDRKAAACRAAVTANGGVAFDAWDNIRVANVGNREGEREVIPDGKLCSAGLADFKGLDIARTDWPTTQLTAGGDFTVTYKSTIQHQGSFDLFLTREGYDPAKKLQWSDLEEEPFATEEQAEFLDGSYRINATLPDGLTGRHVLYTVWRNTDSKDTYYHCSDVVLAADMPGESRRLGVLGRPSTPKVSEAPLTGVNSSPSQSQSASSGGGNNSTIVAGGVAALALLVVGTLVTLRPPRVDNSRHRRD
ncbi:lytic polysaccharide monooxygenase [Streptomyces albipurpureus]|uniref:Lytic polysaccharide monooxygenase n=1 Tax=Streptomyces albipurpureus TaxID=2897419 RepID=A0ABT0UNE9_9ACTN|nr:lytic polysaccharide monooxygenase [Streptomyces sp. CWNU-1]MCM2389852.1 lytic polysaccharide monooxygenase [Streptomyces sp. CWNU-1]